MQRLRKLWLAFILGFFLVTPSAAQSIPVIYSTDIFHPPDDPDDHYDLATLYALKELDVRAIVLDQGRDQGGRPGTIPVEQMNALTGRKVPHVRGLAHPLRYPEDTGEDQPGGQDGPDQILRVLSESAAKVTILTTGSLRDMAAAYNRAPELFSQKVGANLCSGGHSGGKLLEWNTALDPQSYLRIMSSNLPVYWVPCFGSNAWAEEQAADRVAAEPYQSYWKFRQSDLLEGLPSGLQNFFLYALGRISPRVEDPTAYLNRP